MGINNIPRSSKLVFQMSFKAISRPSWSAVIANMKFYLIAAVFVMACVNVGCRQQPEPEVVATVWGASMAPAFLGEHLDVSCRDCGFAFSVAAERLPDHRTATCPNCGQTENGLASLEPQPATPIRLHTTDDPLERWDVVAFEMNDSDKKGIKRVAGLPREVVEIKEGDIWVDGVLPIRTLAQIERMQILDFDSMFLPTSNHGKPDRILILSDSWSKQDSRWVLSESDVSNPGWLFYQPIRCFRGHANRKPTPAVLDNYGYNQSVRRPKLNAVDQLKVVAHIESAPGCRFAVLVCHQSSWVEFVLNRQSNQVEILVDGELQAKTAWEPVAADLVISISTMDRRLSVVVDGREICACPMVEEPQTHKDGGSQRALVNNNGVTERLRQHPVAFRAHGAKGSVSVKRVQVFRDIYYIANGKSQFKLGPDEYLLLGDNSPISLDARHWEQPAIHRSQIIGTIDRESD